MTMSIRIVMTITTMTIMSTRRITMRKSTMSIIMMNTMTMTIRMVRNIKNTMMTGTFFKPISS